MEKNEKEIENDDCPFVANLANITSTMADFADSCSSWPRPRRADASINASRRGSMPGH